MVFLFGCINVAFDELFLPMATTLAVENLYEILFFASLLTVVRSFQCINDLVLLTI